MELEPLKTKTNRLIVLHKDLAYEFIQDSNVMSLVYELMQDTNVISFY